MNNTWLDKEEYPFQFNFFEINGQKLHYVDEGSGQIILFVHGTPSWSFDFRKMIMALRPKYRCIAVDHIGFGLSSKPEHYNYSTINHSVTLEKLVHHLDLKNITMVVHDFGGPIGFNLAINHPNRIKNMVVLNSWLWSSEHDPDFVKLRRILKSPVLPFLYRYFNFSAKFVMPRSFGEKKLSKKLLKQYTLPFANKTQRNGTLAFAKSLLNDQTWFEQLWQKRTAIENKPFLFIWGMNDPVIKPTYLDKFLTGFSNHQVCKLNNCGHFPQEEQPDSVITAIQNFVEKNSTSA